MLLRNLKLAEPGNNSTVDVRIDGKMIGACGARLGSNGPAIHFDNAIVFPGLINSHDHLDFNLFPRIGNRLYHSYREWGEDIHLHNRSAIDAVMAVPQSLRTQWGWYKNLLSGVTTVVNHGQALCVASSPINVFQQYRFIHSVGFDKYWRWKLLKPDFKQLMQVIHAGEGIDDLSNKEIDSCIRWNLFRKPIVAVHGVAMQPVQGLRFRALVWCVDSNLFLFRETAAVEDLKKCMPVLIGTDSTLTAHWDMWTHLRLAASTGKMNSNEIFHAVTAAPAAVWGMKNSGTLATGKHADLVVADPPDGNFLSVQPKDILLVMRGGRVVLYDESIAAKLPAAAVNGAVFAPVQLDKAVKYCIGNLPQLIQEIRNCYPQAQLPVSPCAN